MLFRVGAAIHAHSFYEYTSKEPSHRETLALPSTAEFEVMSWSLTLRSRKQAKAKYAREDSISVTSVTFRPLRGGTGKEPT
jgi:hypothetical protein